MRIRKQAPQHSQGAAPLELVCEQQLFKTYSLHPYRKFHDDLSLEYTSWQM